MDRRLKKRMERYWKKERNKSLREIQGIDINGWFDYWHIHPDWYFKGNRNKETRAWVAAITYDLLQVVEEFTKSQYSRLQVWAILCENTGNNAIFIHSENPNKTPYPNMFDNVEWGVKEPLDAEGIIDRNIYKLGKEIRKGEAIYYIYKKVLIP